MMTMSHKPPLCPQCQTTTMQARSTRSPAGFDIRTFKCPACDHIHQTVTELADPMHCIETNAWLSGQLTAPV